MKIRFLLSTPGIGYCWLANQEIEVDGKILTKDLANQFIDDGYAISLEEEKPVLSSTTTATGSTVTVTSAGVNTSSNAVQKGK